MFSWKSFFGLYHVVPLICNGELTLCRREGVSVCHIAIFNLFLLLFKSLSSFMTSGKKEDVKVVVQGWFVV